MKKRTKEEALAEIASADRALKNYEHGLRLAVQIARERGASWAEIGDVLGVTRQSAHERFGKKGESDG